MQCALKNCIALICNRSGNRPLELRLHVRQFYTLMQHKSFMLQQLLNQNVARAFRVMFCNKIADTLLKIFIELNFLKQVADTRGIVILKTPIWKLMKMYC